MDILLDSKDTVKYLEVGYDDKMQWKYQSKNITQKVIFKLGKIRSISSFFLTPPTLESVISVQLLSFYESLKNLSL